MGWFDDARTRVAKAIQGRPQGITDAQIQQGMNNTSALGPGTPLVPYDGYSQTPRRMDYPVGVNLNQSGRQAWGRTSFETLDALIDAYSPARSAMNHKIDELKSMELLFNPVDGFEGDAEDAIDAAKAVLARPDRVLPYEEWLSLFMEGMLRYDAGVPYKRRNMAGEVIALEIIDGSTVLPFIDEFGRRPIAPAPAYFQKIHGQVWNEFTIDNIEYLRFRPQLKSPFGLAPMESVLLSVNTDLRQQWNLLQMFTEGSVPAGFMTLPPDISSPAQVAQWQEYWDSFVLGDQSMLHKMIVIPNGSEFKNTTPQKFDPDFPKYLERLTYAAFQVVPQDLGITDDVNRACYSEDTETLTENGWKRYDEIGDTERIATFNPETGAIEFHVPDKKYVYPYKGAMVHFASKNVDVMVTPEHRMWAKLRRVSDLWQKITAEELEATNGDFKFVSSGAWEGHEVDSIVLPESGGSHPKPERIIPMDVWLEFVGYIISEGCIYQNKDVENQRNRYKVSLSQSVRVNPDKAEVIDRCVSQLPFAFKSYVDSEGTKRWQVSDKPLWEWLNENIGQKSRTKRIPQAYRNLSQRQLAILLDAMMLGDGSRDTRPNATGFVYYTNSYELAGHVQEIAAKLGYRAHLMDGIRCFRVLMKPDTGSQLRSSKSVSRVAYEGTVWCFHVKNHLFVTRRNGKVTIQGNTGETQTDLQFRVNTLPWVRFIEGMLNRYLKTDIGLPVQVNLNTGRDTEDSLTEVQRWAALIANGMASPDEGRAELTGLPIDNEHPVPRGFFSTKSGWQPLTNVYAAAGPTDPETAAPIWTGAPQIAAPVPGLLDPLPVQAVAVPATVQKDATSGVTTATGIEGVDLIQDDDEDSKVQKELAQFRTFKRGRIAKGQWRDFQFTTVDKVTAHNLNVQGLASIRKVEGEVVAAGLCVIADDSGRVLMLQRGMDPDDDASGMWEFPGGCLEVGESPFEAACREWQEEVGVLLNPVAIADAYAQFQTWNASNGLYTGFIMCVPSESSVDLADRVQVTNPDDPDGDIVESVAWFTPVQLFDNPTVRPELAADLPLVFAAFNAPEVVDANPLVDAVAKAATGSWRDASTGTPQSRFDLRLTDFYAPQVEAALADLIGTIPVESIASSQIVKAQGDSNKNAIKAAVAAAIGSSAALSAILAKIYADGYPAGEHAAAEQLGKHITVQGLSLTASDLDWSKWSPGNPAAAAKEANGGLQALLDQANIQIKSIVDTTTDQVGNQIAAGLDAGDPPAKIAQSIRDYVTAGGKARADMIAHTESTRAVIGATFDTYTNNGVGQWDLITADDPDPECADIASANPHDISDQDDAPPVHPFCLPGSARIVMPADVGHGFALDVSASGDRRKAGAATATTVADAIGHGSWIGLNAVTERDFVGDFITIVTELGNELTITPNHPVATPEGWVDAGELGEGDYVLSRFKGDLPSVTRPDVENVEATIEQVANALPVRFAGVPVAAEDFHGDAANGDVYVVRAARELRDETDSATGETFTQGQLVEAGVGLSDRIGGGDLRLSLDAVVGSPDGIVGGSAESEPILGTGVSHAGEHPLAAVSGLDASVQQVASDDAPADAEGFCETLLADSGEVVADKIISVKRYAISHTTVYNCMTAYGWFIADGIVVHNCRCSASPVVESIDASNIQTVDADQE